MKPSTLIPIATLALTLLSPAADPGWWATRGVKNASSASNLSPATLGQAKHMAAMALAELQPRLAAADYASLQADVATIVNLTPPATQADFDNQKQILLVGQLKTIARPFYDKLRALDTPWVNNEIYLTNSRVIEPGSSPPSYSPYPWSVATSDDSNYSPASVGQLKTVFSIKFENWGYYGPPDPTLPTGPTDTDGDGLSDVTEAAMGTSPTIFDSDGDGYSDAIDFFPLDPSRWTVMAGTLGDQIPPLIVIDSPPTAVYLSGP